jgi:hypothetical protein
MRIAASLCVSLSASAAAGKLAVAAKPRTVMAPNVADGCDEPRYVLASDGGVQAVLS